MQDDKHKNHERRNHCLRFQLVPHTVRMLRKLEGLNVPFRYVDVDADPEDEQRIADWNNGRAIRPTLDIGGLVLVAPAEELDAELKKRGYIS